MSNKREKAVVKTSIISILTNVLLVVAKAIVGLMANSIAIISDAINSLSDALSSIITIVGTKLANRAPDREHPYGHGRTEYVTSFIVSVIVLYAGITALIESFKKIIEPETPDYTAVTLIVLIIGILGKFILGVYVKNTGKKVKSGALVASGVDAFNDGLLSISVLASAIIYMIWGLNIEAYVGILVSVYIIKAGIDLIRESVDSMVGKRVESKLAQEIKREIMKDDAVLGVHDLILNDYGPDTYLGSVHIEVPDVLKAADIDQISRRLTKHIIEKYGIILHTIGIYSINTKNKKIQKLHDEIRDLVLAHKNTLQVHGFYFDKETKLVSFDIVIDFDEKNRGELHDELMQELRAKYPDYNFEITLDADVSD